MRNNKGLGIVEENNTPHTMELTVLIVLIFNSVCDKLETPLEIFDVVSFQESR